MITPLGSAVAPDVKMISAVSSRVTVARGARPVACQSNSESGHTGVGPAWPSVHLVAGQHQAAP